MDFFRKLFPLIRKTSMAPSPDTNGKNISISTINIGSDDQSPTQPNTSVNLNTPESNVILSNKEDLVIISDDPSFTPTIFKTEKGSNIHNKQENVVPNEISLGNDVCSSNSGKNNVKVLEDIEVLNNSTSKTEASIVKNDETLQNRSDINNQLTEIEVMPDEMSNYSGILNNLKDYIEISAIDGQTLQNISKTSMEPEEIGVINDVSPNDARVFDDITNNTETSIFKDEDDETFQNLREFDETLKNFDKTACINNDFVDLINIDEFNAIFGNLDTETNDSIPKINPTENTLEHNSDNTINNNKEDSIKDNNTNQNLSNSDIHGNIDIISISSTEELINQIDVIQDISINSDINEIQKSDDDGYNSSDFEFISETEANRDGFIINFSRDSYRAKSNFPFCSEPSRQSRENMGQRNFASNPGEGPSGLNRPRGQYEDRSYRNNHRIPEGDDYFGLFQGIYNPMMPACEIYFMENKSVRTSAMNVQYDGIGFDKQLALRRPQPDSSEEEFEDEAKECARKIMKMYPGENRKRRRRY